MALSAEKTDLAARATRMPDKWDTEIVSELELQNLCTIRKELKVRSIFNTLARATACLHVIALHVVLDILFGETQCWS